MAKGWTEADMPDLTGRVAVVTGANSGIGFEAALQLAGHGARTILGCRDAGRATAAVERIRATFPKASVESLPLDMASLASIRAFAKAFQGTASKLDILVNNAGVMALPRRTTADGFEMQFGTNHLGHFALAGLLLDRLLASKSGRVVCISSVAHWFGRIRFDDLQGVKSYWKWVAYCQSKLANLLFMMELNRRLSNRSLPALAVGCHPGYANTNLQTVGAQMAQASFQERIFNLGNRLLAQSAARGALPTLYAATSPAIRGGEYIGPRGFFELHGPPGPAFVMANARDEVAARRLWEVSEELTNVRFEALARAA